MNAMKAALVVVIGTCAGRVASGRPEKKAADAKAQQTLEQRVAALEQQCRPRRALPRIPPG